MMGFTTGLFKSINPQCYLIVYIGLLIEEHDIESECSEHLDL